MSAQRSSVPAQNLPPGPFRGRRAELARLCDAVEEMLSGHGQRIWITGTRGMGKSRLLDEIVQYAALRHVSVVTLESEAFADPARLGPGIWIADAVARSQTRSIDDRLRSCAAHGGLGLATETSRGRCLRSGVPETAILALEGLEAADALRLLEDGLESELDRIWARRIVQSTGGHPGRIRQAAERFTRKRRRVASPRPNVAP